MALIPIECVPLSPHHILELFVRLVEVISRRQECHVIYKSKLSFVVSPRQAYLEEASIVERIDYR